MNNLIKGGTFMPKESGVLGEYAKFHDCSVRELAESIITRLGEPMSREHFRVAVAGDRAFPKAHVEQLGRKLNLSPATVARHFACLRRGELPFKTAGRP